VDGRTLVTALGRARPLWLALGLLWVVLDRVIMAAKWGILLKVQGLDRPLGELVRVYFAGTFFGSFLPTGVGGDVIRVLQVARGRSEIGRATASVIMERVIGILALAALVVPCLGVFVLRERPDLLPLLGAVLLVFAVGAALLAVALGGRMPGADRLKRRLPARLIRFADTFRLYARARRALAVFFLCSLVEQLVPVAANQAMGRALDLPVRFTTFLLVIPIILFLVRIPISFDGFGIQEGLYVGLFARAGVPASEAFLLALLGRMITLIGVLPGAFVRVRGVAARSRSESA
jgi:uncharacterized protein (TIRG00374 family)